MRFSVCCIDLFRVSRKVRRGLVPFGAVVELMVVATLLLPI